MCKKPYRNIRWFIQMEQMEYETFTVDDEHYANFQSFLFDELLTSIKHINFKNIIKDELSQTNMVKQENEANGLKWLYTANRCKIQSTNVYTFRFGNPCNSTLWDNFELKTHKYFVRTPFRHRSDDWYQCIDRNLLFKIGKYLKIDEVIDLGFQYKTKLFINQQAKRVDITCDFYWLAERVVITFEPGTPA